MPGPRDSSSLKTSGWIWGAVGAILAAVPIVMAVGVPGTSSRGPSATPSASSSPPSAAPSDQVAPPPAVDSASGNPAAGAGDPDLGVVTPRTSHDAEYDALEAEMAILRGEKSAIEAEEARLRGVRDELEAFDRDHPDGVPPELFARYEDTRAAYNSDVKAYKSRAAAYQMKVADLERRVDALRDGAPAAP